MGTAHLWAVNGVRRTMRQGSALTHKAWKKIMVLDDKTSNNPIACKGLCNGGIDGKSE